MRENEAAPGQTVQVIGRNFLLEGGEGAKAQVALVNSQGKAILLKPTKVEKYSLLVPLPSNLPLGEYEVWVHNGFGGQEGWGGGVRLRVRQPEKWPEKVFNIRDFGAKGDNVTDDSEAFRKALQAVAENGGGIIYFPAGIYRLNGWFLLPRRTVLRGEGMDVTWLKWPMNDPKTRADLLKAVLFTAGEFAIEDLSILVRNAFNVVRDLSFDGAVQWTSGTEYAPVPEVKGVMPKRPYEERDIFLRRVRIHFLVYSGRPHYEEGKGYDPTKDAVFIPELGWWGITNPVNDAMTLCLTGVTNVEISDCEFEFMQRWLEVRNGRIVRNRFTHQISGFGWTDLGGQYLVIEGNQFIGATSFRRWIERLSHLYIAHNYSRNVERGEREAFSFDFPANYLQGVYRHRGLGTDPMVGQVVSAEGKQVKLKGVKLTPNAYRDFDLFILSGKGAGQLKEVAANTEDTVTIAEEWEVLPDESSVAILCKMPKHIICYKNVAEDTSVLHQIWGHAYDFTVDSCEVRRGQGSWGLSGWFVQWLNNRFEIAMTFHRGVGPTGLGDVATPEGGAPYAPVGFPIQPVRQGIWTGEKYVTRELTGYEQVRGAVIRRNKMTHGYRVLVMYGYGGPRKEAGFVAARDIVIDHNEISHTPIGVEIDANTAGVVVYKNTFKGAERPVVVHGKGAQERVKVVEQRLGGEGLEAQGGRG